MRALSSLVLASALLASPLLAQEAPEGAHAPAAHQAAPEKVDIITPHITDGEHMEVPWVLPPFYKEVCLGRHVGEHACARLWDDVSVGGVTLNFSPTKHLVMMLLAAVLLSVLLIGAARAHARQASAGAPRGFASAIEAVVLYLRNEVILPNVGHHGEGFVPYLLTLFFFILTCNLLGLVPYGATATGNIAVTATLATLTFLTVELAGMRALGAGYLSTIFYWNKDLALPIRVVLFLIMSPVELIGKFTKPFALAIRLFANMTAGHIVLLAFVGLIFTFAGPVSTAPFLMAVAISILELFVAFLQAFVFTLLSSVFIGQIREAHH